MDMKIFGDYHIHTRASDGRGTVRDKARRAAEAGLCEIAVADHGCGSLFFHQTAQKAEAQRREAEEVNREGGVRVYASIEASILNDRGELDVPDDVIGRCDMLHVGFHRFLQPAYVSREPRYILVNGWGSASARGREETKAYNTRAWLAVMERYPVDVLCHLCHRAIVDVGAVCRAAAEKGVYVELNEKHIDALEEYAEEAVDSGVKFILGSDAHSTDKVGVFGRVESFVARHNIPAERICGAGFSPVLHRKTDFIGSK